MKKIYATVLFLSCFTIASMDDPQLELFNAIEKDFLAGVRYAIACGASVDDFLDDSPIGTQTDRDQVYPIYDGDRPIIHAIRHCKGDYTIIKTLIDHGCQLRFPPSDQSLPILETIFKGDPKLLELLLSSGTDPNELSYEYQPDLSRSKTFPALFSAISHYQFEMLSILSKYQANMNATDANGQNALHDAAKRRNTLPNIIYTLGLCGTNPNHKDNSGKTPSDLLENDGNLQAFMDIGAHFSFLSNPIIKQNSENQEIVISGIGLNQLVQKYIAHKTCSLFLWACKHNPSMSTLPLDLRKYIFAMLANADYSHGPLFITHMKNRTPIIETSTKNPMFNLNQVKSIMFNTAMDGMGKGRFDVKDGISKKEKIKNDIDCFISKAIENHQKN